MVIYSLKQQNNSLSLNYITVIMSRSLEEINKEIQEAQEMLDNLQQSGTPGGQVVEPDADGSLFQQTEYYQNLDRPLTIEETLEFQDLKARATETEDNFQEGGESEENQEINDLFDGEDAEADTEILEPGGDDLIRSSLNEEGLTQEDLNDPVVRNRLINSIEENKARLQRVRDEMEEEANEEEANEEGEVDPEPEVDVEGEANEDTTDIENQIDDVLNEDDLPYANDDGDLTRQEVMDKIDEALNEGEDAGADAEEGATEI